MNEPLDENQMTSDTMTQLREVIQACVQRDRERARPLLKELLASRIDRLLEQKWRGVRLTRAWPPAEVVIPGINRIRLVKR